MNKKLEVITLMILKTIEEYLISITNTQEITNCIQLTQKLIINQD